MITENLSTLKIHKLTQAQYDRELAAGNIDESALYLTPDEEIDFPVDSVNGKTGAVQLTASDVGAAAASHGNHVPTIETANNAKFLRNDNTWQTVTPANIGARAETFTYASKNGGDCNTYVNETHLFVFNFTNKPTAYNYGWFDVWKASGNGFSPNGAKPIIMQRFICWDTYSRAWRFSTDNGTTWSAWAYDNPPCNSGTEYLTTEYHLGSPVKTKVVNCGTVAAGTTLTFAHGCNISTMVRSTIIADRIALPYLHNGDPSNQYSITGYVDKNNVVVKNGSSNDPKAIKAQIWYTNT